MSGRSAPPSWPVVGETPVVIHSAEIAAHEFPHARKGLDPEAVRLWLRAVAATTAALEEENARLRAERDRLAEAFRRARERSPSSSVRTALLHARLRRRPSGYARADVDELLDAAASEIARLEARTALLEAELETALARGRSEQGHLAVAGRVAALEARIGSRVAAVEAHLAELKATLATRPAVEDDSVAARR